MRRASVVGMAIACLVSCGRATTTVTIHGGSGPVRLTAEVADSPAEREQGLMGRTSLGADEGMVFLHDAPTDGNFWMKDTLIPLSIAFWDDAGTIVGIRDMEPCAADPCPTYGSPAPYVGALEVNQGFFRDHEVTVGDTIDLT